MASKQSIEAGRGAVVLGVDENPLKAGLKAAEQTFKDWGKAIGAIGASVGAIGASIMAPFLQGLSSFADWGREMRTGMRETGIGFEQLDTIVDGMRVGLDELVPATAKMSAFLASAREGAAGAVSVMNLLGLSISELAAMNQGDRMMAFADALSRVGDAGQRIALQREIFGRGGLSLNITGGREGILARAARSDEVEGVLSRSDLNMANEYNKAVGEMKLATSGFWRTLGAVAAGPMKEFYTQVVGYIIQGRQWVERNRELLGIIFRVGFALAAVGTVITAFGGLVYGLSFAFTALKFVMGVSVIVTWAQTFALGVAKVATVAYSVVVAACSAVVSFFNGTLGVSILLLGGFAIAGVIALGIIGALAYAFLEWEDIVSSWGAVFEGIGVIAGQTFATIRDSMIAGDMLAAGTAALLGLEMIWAVTVNRLRDGWFGFTYIVGTAWDQLTAGLAHAMVDFAATVGEIWAAIGNSIEAAFINIVGTVAGHINRMIGLIPAVVRTQLGIGTIDFNRDSALSAMGTRHDEARARREANTALMHGAIDADTSMSERERAAAHAAERERARAEEADIQARMDAAEHTAWWAARIEEVNREMFDPMSGFGGESTRISSMARGDFGANAMLLSGGSSATPEVRAARAAERAAAHLAAIEAGIAALREEVAPRFA